VLCIRPDLVDIQKCLLVWPWQPGPRQRVLPDRPVARVKMDQGEDYDKDDHDDDAEQARDDGWW